jgi:hypothetical protein
MMDSEEKRFMLTWRFAFSAVLCSALVGCGAEKDGRARQPISGAVTVDGQPLKGGYLVFEPQGGQTTQSGGMIVEGKFDVPEQHGPEPGTYSVAIFAEGAPPTTTTAQPGTPEYEAAIAKAKSSQMTIPEKYNVKTELTAEVTSGTANVFNFDLKLK